MASMSKRETDHVASRGNGHVLHPIDRVTHWRSMNALTGIELPEGTPAPRVNRFKRSGIIREKYQVLLLL